MRICNSANAAKNGSPFVRLALQNVEPLMRICNSANAAKNGSPFVRLAFARRRFARRASPRQQPGRGRASAPMSGHPIVVFFRC